MISLSDSQGSKEANMHETFRDYIIALSQDTSLLESFKKAPREALSEARISSEEKAALMSGDSKKITELLGGLELPEQARKMISELGPTRA